LGSIALQWEHCRGRNRSRADSIPAGDSKVKFRADLSDLEGTVRSCSPEDYRWIFFVVHSPTKKLVEAAAVPDYVEIVGAERLAELALDAGLVAWIEDRVS
jgi:hypothetical protein